MKGWSLKTIGEIAEVIAGQSPKSKYYNEEGNGVPFYQGKKEFQDKYLGKPTKWTTKITKEALKGDILMSVRAPVGPVNFSTENICIGRGLAAIRANDNINSNFLYSFFRYKEKELIGNSGAVFNSINKTQISKLKIPIPPIEEQQQIVQILDQAFAKIDQAIANLTQNIQNAEDLFQSKLNQIFSQQGKGWEEKKVNKVFQIKPPKSEAKELISLKDEVSFASMSELGINELYLSTDKTKTLEEAYKGYTYFKNDDVLLAKITPCFENGKLGIAKNLKNEIGFGSSEFIVYRSNGEIIPEYLYHFMNRQNFRLEGERLMKGAVGHKRIPKEFYEEFVISYPSKEKQLELIENLKNLQTTIRNLQTQYSNKLQNLEELKKSLLEKAFSGELTKTAVEV